MVYTVTFKTKWADFDPNNHLRHTAYNDYAAEARVRFLNDNGFSMLDFNRLNIGPILFQENTSFYREIHIGEDITVELSLKGMSENGGKFKFQHKISKENGVLAATIEVFGAWMDLKTRKLTSPPKELLSTFEHLSKTENFEIIPIRKKSQD
jgi:acyl-CoA thioester hydrolase